jgi:hypothetical protein
VEARRPDQLAIQRLRAGVRDNALRPHALARCQHDTDRAAAHHLDLGNLRIGADGHTRRHARSGDRVGDRTHAAAMKPAPPAAVVLSRMKPRIRT